MASFVRGTPLVATVSAVQDIVGEQFLTSIEAASQLELDNLLVASSDAIYDQVDRLVGGSADRITNAEVYQAAVAHHFLARLVMRGWLPLREGQQAPASPFDWSDAFVRNVLPKFAQTGTEGIVSAPVALNATRYTLFGGERPRGYRASPEVRR